ncbi:hypothetical protein GTQ99_19645, partial [Kineococcus sp. T13]|nr:hypothetical protein [Kineococcus vitellinus]
MPPQPSHHEDKIAASFGPNEWLVDELFEQYKADKNSVDEAWWDFFADYTPADNPAGTTKASPPAERAEDAPATGSPTHRANGAAQAPANSSANGSATGTAPAQPARTAPLARCVGDP